MFEKGGALKIFGIVLNFIAFFSRFASEKSGVVLKLMKKYYESILFLNI
ncbi:hypothetical protein FSS13T_14970 [Flavobacterium saliperosum S13]|uniref:Uncharacterized protein n=2 Tax=Flavobacterium saliperosum TaxID=329186 RepID=A0A1G4VFL3_9FLAO|nr:hypothetical protein FSS13T_14970 [Flavobacterium saliperosum S13]SCX06022.1 hypothetical protein SAMN02927925_00931 [Flavobacterium saliperosum]